jgi:DNA-binding response OmpR family regulator
LRLRAFAVKTNQLKQKILYIEDEPHLSRIVKDTLELKGYEVKHKTDGAKIAEVVNSFQPDVCLLDVMLPDVDGFTLANHIRNMNPNLPIIFLTAKNQTEDLVKGFASGGTDYLKKPFSMEELLVRIQNQLKLTNREASAVQSLPDEVVLKQYRFYPGRFELHTPKGVVKLSNRESQILAVLCTHINAAVDRRMLLQMVWGDDSFFNSRNLDVYIRKLRGYFAGADGIEIVTLKGQGYHFVVS